MAKLYPEVSFPVSRGTPSISPLATWELGARYFGYQFRSTRPVSHQDWRSWTTCVTHPGTPCHGPDTSVHAG